MTVAPARRERVPVMANSLDVPQGPRPAEAERSAPAATSRRGVGTDDRPFAPTERIDRLVPVAHGLSSRMAQRYSSSSGQSPEKCIPIEAAVLNSGHSGDLRSR
ncbi:hypothetical protein ACVWXN_001036 [Bradyrhizobium sp. i1.4.4]